MKNIKKSQLWSKDFSCITVATILSVIGGEAMNLPISLLVFSETQSTFLSSLIMVCGMLPDILLPVLVAPLIDKGGKKKWIVNLDLMMFLIYIVMGLWISNHQFNYYLYIIFVLITGTISVFYRLAYQAWYPDLIPVGHEQKGYAVSATIYPVVTIIMSPIAAFLYDTISIGNIFLIVAGITLISVLIESLIKETRKKSKQRYTLEQYFKDLREGFSYLKNEKGIRNIYTYMSITNGTSHGIVLLTQAYYQTAPWLSVTMFGLLKSAEMIGRFMSGIFQYVLEIPVKKRYAFTKFVYIFYNLMDGILLFMPYPLMLVNRFICGGLGTSSATIRETAVKSYLPQHMRARISAFFNMIFAVGGVLSQMLAGVLGQVMSYKVAAVCMSCIPMMSVFFLIILPDKQNRPVYEATRVERE
ncbi:MAG: MFS transporter [Vallitalea sp.]|jgi:MFS family permease|nr:MFS transporter [Vallitalea sp.]